VRTLSASQRKALVALGFLGFVILLLWTTLSSQKVTCHLCVKFGNGRNCATASASSEKDAAQSAQTTACGVLARGMTESLACAATPPESRRCQLP